MLFLDAFTHFLLVKYFNNTIQPNLLTNSIDRLTKKDGPIIHQNFVIAIRQS